MTLTGGHKFDLRLYVLVFTDPLRVFLHRDGGVKVAAHSSKNETDPLAHLTNIALKGNEQVGEASQYIRS